MSNRRLAKTFLTLAVSSASTEATSYPKENAIDRTSPQRAWRTTVVTDSNIVIDLGSNQTTVVAYLDWVNFTTVKYQESAASTGPWVDLTANLTISPDDMSGVYRRVDNLTLTTKRYLRIVIPAQTPVDGASYFRIGTFCVPSPVVELDSETWFEYPLDYSIPDSNIVVNTFPTGRSERIKLGNMQPMLIGFALQTESLTNIHGTKVKEITDLLRDSTNTLFLDFNLGESYQAYLVKKTGELRASVNTPNVNTADFGTIIFETVI